MFTLNAIQTTKQAVLDFYLNFPRRALRDVIAHAHSLCPELAAYVTANESVFNSRSSRDKGLSANGRVLHFRSTTEQ